MITLFSLPNLATKKVNQDQFKTFKAARLFASSFDVPKGIRKAGKELYRDWCIQPDTDHCFLSLTEAVNGALRSNTDNPPHLIYGMVAEFDKSKLRDDDIAEIDCKYAQPNFVCRSFSGYARLFWIFEKPILWHSKEFWTAFCLEFWKALNPKSLLPGFAQDESSNPLQWFEVGRDWQTLNTEPMSSKLVQAIRKKAIDKVNWRETGGRKLSEERLRDLLRKKYGEGAWTGGWDNFKFGARGRCFWDSDAQDETACVAYENGCKRYTDDAPFVFWDQLLDPKDVEREADELAGETIERFVYEHKVDGFWLRRGHRMWDDVSMETVRQELRCMHVSEAKQKGQTASEMDEILCTIRRERRFDSVISEFYSDKEFVMRDGKKCMNIASVSLMEPHPDPNPKGKGFPQMLDILRQMFDEEQLERFLAWTRHFYQCAYNRRLERGLGLILAGPAGTGKSFLINGLLCKVFGCRAKDVSPYIHGTDSFSGRLFTETPILYASDSVRNPFIRGSKQNMSEKLKEIISNDWKRVRFMRQEAYDMLWLGRIIMLMNLDSNSLRNAPDLDISIQDKLLCLRIIAQNQIKPPTDTELAPELPFFCSYLLDSKQIVELDPRFGIKAWIEPRLFADIQSQSPAEHIHELIDTMLEELQKRPIYEKQAFWRGTATDIRAKLLETIRDERLIPEPVWIGRTMGDLCTRYPDKFQKAITHGRTYYKMFFQEQQ